MTEITTIECKPTSWFWSRAIGMLAMFLFLGGWFYKDAAFGYREKNLIFRYEKAFEKAANDFLTDKNAGKTEADWVAKAATQTIDLGKDTSILPVGTPIPSPWPTEMQDPAIIGKGPGSAWGDYRARMKWNKADDKIHNAGSIREQWYYAYGLCALAIYTLFILVRTSRRKISADATTITTQEGRVVPFASLYELDLRKWSNKGLAFAKYKLPDGKNGVVRVDGLTYGGFKTEQDEPAEQLMRRIKENFKGEIIDYEVVETASATTEVAVTEEKKQQAEETKEPTTRGI